MYPLLHQETEGWLQLHIPGNLGITSLTDMLSRHSATGSIHVTIAAAVDAPNNAPTTLLKLHYHPVHPKPRRTTFMMTKFKQMIANRRLRLKGGPLLHLQSRTRSTGGVSKRGENRHPLRRFSGILRIANPTRLLW